MIFDDITVLDTINSKLKHVRQWWSMHDFKYYVEFKFENNESYIFELTENLKKYIKNHFKVNLNLCN